MNAMAPALSPIPVEDGLYLSLARSIAMDLQELGDILKVHGLTQDEWLDVQNQSRFQEFLKAAIEDWNRPLNTPERIRLKALAMVELGLEEMWKQLHNDKEPLNSRVELFKTVAKMGSVDVERRADQPLGNEAKFSVVINLGADTLKISAPVPKAIDTDDH